MTYLPTNIPTNVSFVATHGKQNGTNDSACPSQVTEEWAYTGMQVYILLISVLGILFNVFVLMVFCFHKKPCTVAEVYLSNLAAADLILVSFLPFWGVSTSKGFNWPFGSAMCRLVNISIIMNMYCSIYFLVLVSIDRYLALVHPLTHDRIRTPRFAKLACALVWVLGFLLSVPTLIYRETKQFSHLNATMCYLNCSNNVCVALEGLLTTFSFVIPIPIISFCAWKIIKALNNRLQNSQKNEHKATTLILAVLFAFLICWVPLHLVRIMELLKRAAISTDCNLRTVVSVCKPIFTYLAFFNSVLNPILYVIVGKNFRKKVRELFKQSTHKRRGTFSFSSTRTSYLRSFRSVRSTANEKTAEPNTDHTALTTHTVAI